MKPRESALRLMRFEAREKARKVADLEAMIREFELMVDDLDRQVTSEEERTGVRDLKHFAYSTFAKAARQRRENLRTSIDDLKAKLAIAVEERDLAADNLEKVETPEAREVAGPRARRTGDDRNPSALAS
ncbi:MAG: flagellar export protein FliJ [Hyphomicrobiaceae bacterium]